MFLFYSREPIVANTLRASFRRRGEGAPFRRIFPIVSNRHRQSRSPTSRRLRIIQNALPFPFQKILLQLNLYGHLRAHPPASSFRFQKIAQIAIHRPDVHPRHFLHPFFRCFRFVLVRFEY